MLNGIQNLISNPTLYNLTQSTVTQVTTETCLKAAGRPSFILMDKQIDPQTKKFSATKELLYQLVCLGIYLSLVHQVKRGSMAIGRKMFKNEQVFKAFKHPGEFMDYFRMDDAAKAAKLSELNKTITSGDKFTKENINLDLGKGVIEGCSIAGSVLGLAVLAPIISHPLIHPILKACGMEKKPEQKEQEPALQTPEQKA